MPTVTMQLNVGANEAGDWANRETGEAGTATAPGGIAAPSVRASSAHDELMIRLSGLRGAIEAMRDEPHGATLADTRTAPASVGYGAPSLYHGMCFVVELAD